MKRYFGSLLLRRMRGGIILQKREYQIVASMVAELPDHLRGLVERQFNECNLAQREVGGRTLNFYKMSVFSSKPQQLQTALYGSAKEAALVGVSVYIPGDAGTLQATLNAIAGRAFSVSFSRPLPEIRDGESLQITTVTHTWQSIFPASSDA